MIDLQQRSDGVILPVRAQAGAKSSSLRGEQDGALKVSVTQAAEQGKANKAIIALLCKTLRLRRSQVELFSGASSTRKRFFVQVDSAEELRRRLAAALKDC